MKNIIFLFLISCSSNSQPKLVKEEILLPSTCYFINRSCMDEFDMICQRGKKEDYGFCVNWTWHLDGDVCDDYYNLFMEEYHIGQTVNEYGYLE